MTDAFRVVDVTRLCDGARAAGVDRAATEEPLEIRLHGHPFAVVMRTPGADRELTAGFLLAERVLTSADDLGAIAHCTDPSADHPENIIDVTLAGTAVLRLDEMLAGRRLVTIGSSCGMCGRLTVESLRAEAPRVDSTFAVAASVLTSLPSRLRVAQAVFDQTGGLHAAALFTSDGQLEDVAEDVGRHNAVDKVVGRTLMRESLPLADRLLFVSGRTSFEIVQKAFLAGMPVVASVSAPSTLAIELAEECSVTLVGFVRGETCNIYTHPARIH